MASLSQFHIRILLNGPQDARPGKIRFAYAESPAKQRRDRDMPDTAHNPNELGRIRILLPVVSSSSSLVREGMKTERKFLRFAHGPTRGRGRARAR